MSNRLNMLAVIQARMSSRRFPGKVLQALHGTPMLVFLIHRIQQASCIDKLVVATSINPADDVIVEYLKGSGIDIIRGSEDDVLTRYLQALEAFPAQHVIRITADNPLSDPELLDLNAQNFLEKNLDYAYMKNVPVGTACDIFRSDVLRYIDEHTHNLYCREHINAYILDHQHTFRLELFVQVPDHYRRPDLSFTVDARADFEWVQSVISQGQGKNNMSLAEIIRWADTLRKFHG